MIKVNTTLVVLATILIGVTMASCSGDDSMALERVSESDDLSRELPEGVVADSLVVLKAERVMQLHSAGRMMKAYRVGLGFDPVGHKQEEGDGRTPEGCYRVSGRNPHSAFHLSLRVSYPNAQDRERARRRGVSPGGDIFIHGWPNGSTGGPGRHPTGDWTLGCIAVTSPEIEELWSSVPDGTPVIIRP